MGHVRQRAARAVWRFAKDRSAAVALYVGLSGALLAGTGAIVFDVGRLGVVKTQMQNAADAAALAAAVHLDGLDGARVRAQAVAENAAAQQSMFETTGGGTAITVANVTFYSAYTPAKVAATSDADAAFVEVTITPRNVSLMMEPVLALVAGTTSQGSTQINSFSVATTQPIICDAPPLMMCDPLESSPPIDLSLAVNAGRQINI
jgi:Flp pilus assembly protein TadG